MVCYCVGTLVHWHISALVDWYISTLAYWYIGARWRWLVVQWYFGILVHWGGIAILRWYIGTLVHYNIAIVLCYVGTLKTPITYLFIHGTRMMRGTLVPSSQFVRFSHIAYSPRCQPWSKLHQVRQATEKTRTNSKFLSTTNNTKAETKQESSRWNKHNEAAAS